MAAFSRLQCELTERLSSVLITNPISQLYAVMYNVIDTCYGQNLGFDSYDTAQGLTSAIYEGDRQLKQWQYEVVPSLGLHILQTRLTATDIDVMKSENVVTERFNIVLSMRFHNLRILLHRRSLEKHLNRGSQSHWHKLSSESEGKLQQQVEIDDISNCVESATIIISTVHTIVTAEGWVVVFLEPGTILYIIVSVIFLSTAGH
jgi:hypothetical protein